MFDSTTLYDFDRLLARKHQSLIIGIDEAGRGPLAGPVVAAAVQLDLDKPISGINDSKKITPKNRESVFQQIVENAVLWAVGIASPKEIDQINILQATLVAMKRAFVSLDVKHEQVRIFIDGNQNIRSLPLHMQQTVVGGDRKSASIAAASIIAKVTRDRMMEKFHSQFPQYEFNKHKGYATVLHREHVLEYGLCPIHRKSFCEKIISQTTLPL